MLTVLFVSLLDAGSAAFQKVSGLPNADGITDVSYSGLVEVDASRHANLFGWFFPSRHDPSVDPLVLWMTGGPGCSSELAVLFENGPFTVDESLALHSNPYSWTNNASLLFVDQPFGTGFSPKPRGDIVFNEQQMARYMYEFLQGFLTEFPAYRSRDFFITGESFAGHYIPVLGAYVVQMNGMNKKEEDINLKGVAIGNGWVQPLLQYNYGPFAVQNGWAAADSAHAARWQKMYQACYTAMVLEEFKLASDMCNMIMEDVVRVAPKIDGYPINHYNIEEPCVMGGLCYNFTKETAYMNLAQTQTALGVSGAWDSCSSRAGLPLSVDRLRSFAQALPVMLVSGVEVMVYYGKWDLICEWMGGLEWVNQLTWSGRDAFSQQTLQDWTQDGQTAGQYKTYAVVVVIEFPAGLTFLAVEKSGHMVPHDQPAWALAMLNRFTSGKGFSNDGPYNCYTKEVWSSAKQAWCCKNAKLGCPNEGSVKSLRQDADQAEQGWLQADQSGWLPADQGGWLQRIGGRALGGLANKRR